ncbi:MAG: hypothetical protein JXQ23_04965 [Clostridia bacterium]|nr:hypothetical protein [Clostridia bacterium]
MVEPINFVFFFVPLLIITGLYFLVAIINKQKQPFGYKAASEITAEQFTPVLKDYYRKVLFVSVPLIVIVPVVSIFITSFPVGALLLVVSVLGMSVVNFLFFIQGYNKIKTLDSK